MQTAIGVRPRGGPAAGPGGGRDCAVRAAAGTRTKKVGNQTGTDAGHARPRTDGPSRSPDGSLGTRDGTALSWLGTLHSLSLYVCVYTADC